LQQLLKSISSGTLQGHTIRSDDHRLSHGELPYHFSNKISMMMCSGVKVKDAMFLQNLMSLDLLLLVK